MKDPKFIQLMATVEVHNGVQSDVRQATPEEVAEKKHVWSVYKGEPGAFEWLGDFVFWIDAAAFARKQAQMYGAQLIEGGA